MKQQLLDSEGAPPVQSSPIMSVAGVSRRYGPVTALEDVSFDLRAGEVIGLIGDNGAGKSTLVSLISGTKRPDEGRIVVGGQDVRFRSPADAKRYGIETVFQNLALIPTLSIADNVYLGREIFRSGTLGRLTRSINRKAMIAEAARGFERLGVKLPSLSTKAGALSGGQRQSVSIGRAVLWGSHIVVMDEPAAALGVEQTELVLALIERLRDHGVGVILISHNMEHVMRVADRAVVMRRGRKVADLPISGTVDATHLVGLITGAISIND